MKPTGSWTEVFFTALQLGLTSFGGPVAHLGYFQAEYVRRRKWLDDATYADLIALCQFLPGPASSQLGIAIGMLRAGYLGGLAAWLGFTLPSAIALTLFAYGVQALPPAASDLLQGLKIVAVAVVAQAVWGLGRNLCPDRARVTLAIVAAIVMLVWSTALSQIVVIVAAGLIGWRLLPGVVAAPAGLTPAATPIPFRPGRAVAVGALVLFFAFLIGLPLLRQVVPGQSVALFDSFYRAGSLVFGGGHVVLPLLQNEVVPPGWVSNEAFVAGYGAAQAVPGPLFTFAAYLGAVSQVPPNGWLGAAIATVAIFLPSFFLIVGFLPLWDTLRLRPGVRAALAGVNAGVVGLLLAALYHPVWTSAILGPADVALALGAFALLVFWKLPPWLVVVVTAPAGALVGLAI